MKNKMKFLIKQSLSKKIKTKWFVAVNVVLFMLLVSLANIDRIITFFGGDFTNVIPVKVVDNTDSFVSFENNFTAITNILGDMGNFEITLATTDVTELKNELAENNAIIVVFTPDEEEFLVASVYSFNSLDIITTQLLISAINTTKTEYALVHSGIDIAEFVTITAPATVEFNVTDPDFDATREPSDALIGIITVVFILPFFILVMLLVQMIGAEINDEKTSRSMEIIISNVSPKVHFFSKIIASTGFVLLQSFLLFIYGAMGFLIRFLTNGGLGIEGEFIVETMASIREFLGELGILAVLAESIPIILLLLVLSLFAFALLAGILASMTTSIEDFQQLQAPLMIILIAGYYLAMMAVAFQGATFIQVASMLPFLSAMIAPVLFLLGQTTLFHLLLSTLITAFTCFLLFHFGLRIYKVGILNYSSKNLWRKIFKSMKEPN